MASPLGSPTRHIATAPDQPQGERRESPRQEIGLSKLDTAERLFQYLDFAEGGTNAALNKWGQFLQLSSFLAGGSGPDSMNYISIEPRNIFRLEYMVPTQTSDELEQGEEEDEEGGEGFSKAKRRTLGWEPDNPEWKPSVSFYNDNPSYPRRHDKFNALCMENQGLGLRFSDNTNISEPEHYYRNDRWPEVHYTVEGKVKVVLQHYIRDGEIIQDMCLTSESSEETELSLEFEFSVGIRIAPGNMRQPKVSGRDAPDHFLEPDFEGEALLSDWKIQRGKYYATASLFEDGKPKSFNLPWGNIKIFSDDPVRHREIFPLKPKGKVKFTSVFKLGRGNEGNTPPQYLDISPHLKLFDDRWWSFKTKSSSFIFRRSLETILSHAIPLPPVRRETYEPYVLHNHDLVNTHPTLSSILDQAFYLLEIDKVLQQQNTTDPKTKSHYRERIKKVIFGCFILLLPRIERNSSPDAVPPYRPGKPAPPAKQDETGELAGEIESEEEEDVPRGPMGESPNTEAEEISSPIAAPAAKVDSTDPKTDPSLSAGAPGSTSGIKKASKSRPRKTEKFINPTPGKPLEPELSKYKDNFHNFCRLLVLLDRCSTNYPDEKPLIARIVGVFLKPFWEPIEMSKHRGSDLWPDRLEIPRELPPPYARFQRGPGYRNSCYGGQGIYVYDIATQVLVWRAVKSTNRLLRLVPDDQPWIKRMDRQILNEKAIRDWTIEVFRTPGTGTSQGSFPDRFISKIKGHNREPFREKRDCTIAIPSVVDDFFFDDNNKPISTWIETLRYCDTFNDSVKAQTPDTWESFMRYQLAFDRNRRQELRESLEASAYSVGLFASGVVTPGSHCPQIKAWDIVTYVLSADHTELAYPQSRIPKIIDPPTRADRAQEPMPLKEGLGSVGRNPRADSSTTARWEGSEPGKEGKVPDITAEDGLHVNDPPSYGEWYWFGEPLFIKHNPEKFESIEELIGELLQPEYIFAPGESWGNWCCFWETEDGKDKFLESIANIPNYEWGHKKNTLIRAHRNLLETIHGGEALSKLQEQRDRGTDKKRIIVMEDCAIEHLISLMNSLNFQEAGHTNEFLSRLRHMDRHKMSFVEQTIMPDNLWITEFNINFITAPFQADVESPLLPNYFPRRRAKFLSMNDAAPDRIMAEAAMGFRIIGDLHDRYWTCYVFYDFGSQELTTDAWTRVERIESCNTPSQRKCLEGFLVRQALDLVLSQTKTILDTINKSKGEENKSQELFSPLLTGDDLRGENYFKTMNKNSVFYPWLLDVYGALRDKCNASRKIAAMWISAECGRKYKPRWSEKDKKRFGSEVAQYRANVRARCARLEKMADDIQERIDRIKTLKESLSSELALREARTSTQLAHTVNLFAVVTAIYLPLTFSTSIVAIQDFHWPSPAKALVRIALAVTFGTIILLMNLAFLRRNLAALKRWAQRSIRKRMAGAPKPKKSSEGPIYQHKRPAWKYWKKRARSLHEAEKRSALLTDNDIHDNESDWWYWYFMVIYITVVVPVQELTFIIRTLRRQRIKNAGPLKKFVKLPWAPIWVLQLALVYVVMLAGYAVLSLARFVHHTAVWLWTGNDTVEGKKAAPEEVEKSLMADLEGDEESSEPEPDSTQQDWGLGGWFMKPAKKMMLPIVKEALQPKKRKKEPDPENQGTAVEDLETPSSN